MLKSKSFLAVDCGANTLKVAEFEPNDSGGLRLKRYALRSLGLEGSQDTTRESSMIKALQEVLAEQPFSSRQVNLCAPGFHVFSRFVKMPAVDSAKIAQIIEFEAKQNVPFPLEEVVWDYQILGTSAVGELEVLLVAIKSDVVEGLFRAGETAGLRPQLVDVSSAALCNAFRFNYGDPEGCSMLLDIGAKTSNLLFFEKGKVYSRSINIGANAITQEFANESKLHFSDADQVKIEKGFVSLGGAYEEPDDPQAAAISKIARQVMTRLHIQVNQTIQFYRGQQGGTAPQQLFLSGGASVMPYMAQFFSEKLNLPVEYFNPFRNVEIDSSINLEELQKVAHSMGEVVGLGLRGLAHCPVELNLLPKSSLKRQDFNQKKPYFLATVYSLVLVVFCYGFLQQKITDVKRTELDRITGIYAPLNDAKMQLDQKMSALNDSLANAEQVRARIENRAFWPELLPALRRCLIDTENITTSAFKTNSGLWIEKMTTVQPTPQSGDVQAGVQPQDQGLMVVSNITILLRGADLTPSAADGNTRMSFTFLRQLHTNYANLFDTNLTDFQGTGGMDSNTFTTPINLQLKKPLNF